MNKKESNILNIMQCIAVLLSVKIKGRDESTIKKINIIK